MLTEHFSHPPKKNMFSFARYIRNPPKKHGKIYRGAQGHPGGPNGPALVLWDTQGGATWKCAVSQDPAAVGPATQTAPYLLRSTLLLKSLERKPSKGGGGVFPRELLDCRLQSLSMTNFAARIFSSGNVVCCSLVLLVPFQHTKKRKTGRGAYYFLSNGPIPSNTAAFCLCLYPI
jgi:hypothetical protein